MKKLPIFLTTILGLGLGLVFSPGASALYIDEDNVTWYTVAELLDYKQLPEKQDENKNRALEQLIQYQFVVTAMNPGQEYIKTLFFSDEMTLARMGIQEKLTINQVYIGWLETDLERIYRDGMDLNKYRNGEIEGAHLLYSWQSSLRDKLLIASDVETRLETTDLGQSVSGQLIYNIDSGPGKFAALGRFIYSECFAEPDYAFGTECRLMISAEKGSRYMPPRETTISVAQEDKNPVESFDIASQTATNNNVSATTTVAEPAKTIKAPSTGASTNPCNQKTIEFPWWLVIVIALGDAAVLWLFWPNGKKTKQKH